MLADTMIKLSEASVAAPSGSDVSPLNTHVTIGGRLLEAEHDRFKF